MQTTCKVIAKAARNTLSSATQVCHTRSQASVPLEASSQTGTMNRPEPQENLGHIGHPTTTQSQRIQYVNSNMTEWEEIIRTGQQNGAIMQNKKNAEMPEQMAMKIHDATDLKEVPKCQRYTKQIEAGRSMLIAEPVQDIAQDVWVQYDKPKATMADERIKQTIIANKAQLEANWKADKPASNLTQLTSFLMAMASTEAKKKETSNQTREQKFNTKAIWLNTKHALSKSVNRALGTGLTLANSTESIKKLFPEGTHIGQSISHTPTQSQKMQPFEECELNEALTSIANGSAPGPSGLTGEFLRDSITKLKQKDILKLLDDIVVGNPSPKIKYRSSHFAASFPSRNRKIQNPLDQ